MEDKMKKRIKIFSIVAIVIVAIVLGVFIATRNNDNPPETSKNITICVYNKEGENIYNKAVETEKTYLIDVLKDLEDLTVVTQDSQYGAYITAIMGIEQGDDYYWSYYINNDYAMVGVSSCVLEEGKTYNFKIEKMSF